MTPARPSSLGLFWRSLVEDGRVGIFSADPPTADDLPGLHRFLAEYDADRRLHLAHSAPPLDPAAAEWACTILFRACQFLVIRDIEADVVSGELAKPCPGGISAPVLYSVDLALSHLGVVLKLADRIAADDPLTTGLRNLARAWPLSSVGIPDVGAIDVQGILSDKCLTALYVDRIIAHVDQSRLDDPLVARRVAAALGGYPELAPTISHHLAKACAHEEG